MLYQLRALTVRSLILITCFFLVVVLLIVSLSRSSLQGAVINRLTIPSRSNTGITFQAPVKGIYVFEYASGGFLIYDLPLGVGCDHSSFKCFSAMLVGFRGDKARWTGRDLDFSLAVFSLGGANIAWTLDEAQEQVVGERATVSLRAGQEITLVAGDWHDAYDDNTGDMTVNVYFLPT